MSESNHGKGGAYEIDPQTGERRLVERTEQPTEAPEPAAPAEPAPARKTTRTRD